MKYKALQIAPEHQDSRWDWFTDDECRLWSVVGYDRGRYYLDSATPHFKRAFELLDDYDKSYYESHMNEWLNDVIEGFYCGEGNDICTMCGLTQPEWQEARQKAKRATRDYCEEIDNCNRRGRSVEIIPCAVDLLSAVTGIKFYVREIHGCCQGD